MPDEEGKTNPGTSTGSAEPAGETKRSQPETATPRTFTQEQVNEIVRERLERDHASLLKQLGEESWENVAANLKKGKGYDELAKKSGETAKALEEANRKICFESNKLDPERESDIRAILQGKGLEFNDENIKKELPTHPEWALRKEAAPVIGSVAPKKEEDVEKQMAEKIWRLKF